MDSMKFSVPFIPDSDYINFLSRRRNQLASVYFSMGHGQALDARVQPSPWEQNDLIQGLKRLGDVPAYALLNTRFLHPEHYGDQSRTIMGQLEELHRERPLAGMVVTDFYLVQALAQVAHPLAPALELVPGINCMIDSPEKARAFLGMIRESGFKTPSRLIADRSLNRNLPALETLVKSLGQDDPDMEIELLANEGCLAHCPFKLSHDAQVSFSNTGLCREQTARLNRELGCRSQFMAHPEQIFTSPFIRPEDQNHYAAHVTTLKLCGRTLGPRFLERCIRAYQAQRYEGNLLDLLDASHFMADHFHLDNSALGKGFLQRISLCTKQCKPCKVCRDLHSRTIHPKPVQLKRYKDQL